MPQISRPPIRQTFNNIYAPMFTTSARYIDIWGGRGRGGSHTGTDYFLHLITQPNYFRGYFVRQAFSDIRDSLFRDFKDRIDDNDTLDIEDFAIQENEMRIMYKPTGNMIMSKGVKKDGNRTAKLKSLAGATHVLIEEADELGEEDFDQMDLSLRTMKSEKIQIIRIFNPPHKQHWIWRDYVLLDAERPADYKEKDFAYFKAVPKETSNLLSIFSTYLNNRKNIQPSTAEKFESFKLTKPEYYYTVIKGLISEGMRGRIFSNWHKITNDEFNQIDARSIFGQDFGTSAPAGTVESKIVKNRVYLREHNYVGKTDKELGIMYCILGLKNEPIICDSAEPQTIFKLRTGWKPDELTAEEIEKYAELLNGFNVFGVGKAPGSVNFSIKLLKDYEVYVTEESVNLWNEYREYRWALDRNKNPTDEPEDHHNHLIDPTRYIIMSKGSFF